jgi:hypothetical protein
MNRNNLLTQNLPQIFLALAVLAVSLLVLTLIRPITLPVSYASDQQVSQVLSLNRAQQADAARWQAQAAGYNSLRAQQAYTARLQGQAEFYNLYRSREADAQRWQAMAQAFNRQRAQEAYTARLQGQADRYLKTTSQQTLNKAQRAYAERLNAQAGAYFTQLGGLPKIQLAEAARWTAMALHYDAAPEHISPQLGFILTSWNWLSR